MDSKEEPATAPELDRSPPPSQVTTPIQTSEQAGSVRERADLSPVLLGGGLAIVGGFLATLMQAWIQDNQFERQFAISVAQQQHAEAVAAFREMTDAVDRPIETARRVIREARNPSTSADSLRRLIAAFRAERSAWDISKNRSRLLASIYFRDEGESDILRLDSLIAWVDVKLNTALEIKRGVPNESRLPSQQLRELRVAGNETLAAIEDAIKSQSELVFRMERVWASMIQARQAGTFNPLAPYDKFRSRSDSQ